MKTKYFTTRKLVSMAMLAAVSTVLMIFDLPVFFAPSFYKIDFSELPALIGGFAFGPLAGVIIELLKVLLKLLFKGTSTAFVGEIANFLIGSSFVLTASLIYKTKKTKKIAIAACSTATVVMTVFGCALNAFYLLPAFSKMYGMDLEKIIAMGTAINPAIKDITTFVVIAVAPLNIVKGVACSMICLLIYKTLRKVIH